MQNLKPKGRDDSHEFDYSKITEQIYVGSDFCKGGVCLIHGEEFKKLGITTELNLSKENNELPPKDLETYSWLPVVDGYSPSQEQLDVGTSVMDGAIKGGKNVFVHCKNGHGRSPTMVAAYFIRYKKMGLTDAVGLIKNKRAEIHIEDTQKKELEKFQLRWSK